MGVERPAFWKFTSINSSSYAQIVKAQLWNVKNVQPNPSPLQIVLNIGTAFIVA